MDVVISSAFRKSLYTVIRENTTTVYVFNKVLFLVCLSMGPRLKPSEQKHQRDLKQ